ncbi:carboxypeptidase-like regulatory domain-containing protein [Hymenobacter sp. UYCo722]|uniref:carboxypeptidase-like regulatory domain-containing protein n=1 Tax=Hymenobacter sp. UYCo722 TaxID=3156335 RepID=UPI00339889CF
MAAADALAGQVIDQGNSNPLGFVSVGVLGHPYGTVADAQGRFTLDLPASYDADSVRFSLVGYASRTWQVGTLRRLVRSGPLQLMTQPIPLAEAQVSSVGLKRRVLGNTTIQKTMRIDEFASNKAGNQIGQRITIKRPAFMDEVSFSITHCTYDTIAFRLNVYKLRRDYPAENILPAAIYFKVTKQQAKDRIHLNLRRQHLYLTEDVVVAVELVRALDKGTLEFGCQFAGGGPFYKLEQTPGPDDAKNVVPKNAMSTIDLKRKQPDGPWTKYPNIGLGIDATIREIPE